MDIPDQTRALHHVVDEMVRTLSALHTALPPTTVDVVVRHAASELVISPRTAPDFTRLLRLRTTARLQAMSGTLTPIRTPHP